VQLGGLNSVSLREWKINQKATALALFRDTEHSDKNSRDGEDRIDFRTIWEANLTIKKTQKESRNQRVPRSLE
jgi:hypothetical protein